ncbi:GTP 3',8-cyclase MoaA [Fischerella thermalis]|jgi:cyclic pyranopterin phosphate synthase|uniref:GTP 3',8-cyclase MoaA n=1 Tax=Fischerella thermalis TaxID=372787 RepID=UPI000360B6E1|nr:GTP 3',8-cyclase MoaA [Fischerella thermalis]MBF1991443.1 GTP 3',8-cyclase MoaA [Fischerella thermalis M58_A2018_009]MBF2058680.1 GTP 3',8-cyclase MoaA [Fischerella thermalis M66_A2018_004]MBF2070376.1 GTP 3',8-cyclase MoaA [Fischerella thermalis M48_A2018_028]PLZ05293.1 GTP 3',8-cyclase MoaA [Fischerella thermalis WC119]PLZ11670.1 GTP 3',8-cyclase MoaA [Fischerella thermalis WC1110]
MNQVDYLRISLIDRCNFRCQYCMPEGTELDYILKQDLLTDEELLTLIQKVFIPVGFTRFRLTGGEPLLRPRVVELVRAIASFRETQDLSMTTNGFLLAPMAQSLYHAGLRRINISLDSLDPEVFDQIIGNRGRSRWQDVWNGIQAAYSVGFDPLKINVVVIPDVNDQEILDLAALTIDKQWHVRFIEFMPIGNLSLFGDRGWISSAELRQRIHARWGLTESQVRGSGPADIFQIPGAKGTLGFISQMSECFCDRCNRMRLSADGWLRPCLLNETGQIDLKTALRTGVSTTELRQKVRELLAIKPEINFKSRDSGTTGAYTRTMSQIGG